MANIPVRSVQRPGRRSVQGLFRAPGGLRGARRSAAAHEGGRRREERRLHRHAELPGVKKEDIQVTIDGAEVTLAPRSSARRKCRRTSACCIPSALRQGVAQLHAAAGSGRGQGRSQVPRRRARADAAEESGGGAQADHDPVSFSVVSGGVRMNAPFITPSLMPGSGREGAHPRRGAALHPALPRQDHRRQVRRQRHDRRGAEELASRATWCCSSSSA